MGLPNCMYMDAYDVGARKNDYGLYQTARSGSEERREESLRCSMGLDPLLRPFVFVLLYALLMDCTKDSPISARKRNDEGKTGHARSSLRRRVFA